MLANDRVEHGVLGVGADTWAARTVRGGADYSARQLAYFRPRTPPETFARMFPNYAA